MVARTTTCCPALPWYSLRSAAGTSSASDTASSASGVTCATCSEWNFSISQALEVIERLTARAAAEVRLARRRAKFGEPLAVPAAAARTADGGGPPQPAGAACRPFRRGDAEGAQLFPTRRGQPVARPGRRQHLFENRIGEAGRVERGAHHGANHLGRRATGVGRRQADAQASVARTLYVPDDP